MLLSCPLFRSGRLAPHRPCPLHGYSRSTYKERGQVRVSSPFSCFSHKSRQYCLAVPPSSGWVELREAQKQQKFAEFLNLFFCFHLLVTFNQSKIDFRTAKNLSHKGVECFACIQKSPFLLCVNRTGLLSFGKGSETVLGYARLSD